MRRRQVRIYLNIQKVSLTVFVLLVPPCDPLPHCAHTPYLLRRGHRSRTSQQILRARGYIGPTDPSAARVRRESTICIMNALTAMRT